MQKPSLDQLRIPRPDEPEERSAAGWILLCLLGLIVLVAVCWYFLSPRSPELQVQVVEETGSSSPKTLLNASGYVVARREATVSSKVTGKVVEVLVEEGMRVKEGQLLARLDASNVERSLELARAQLASARSSLEETKVRLAEAEAEYRRVNGLATNQVSSASDLDHARAAFRSYAAHLEQQQSDVLVAERQVGLWQQQLDDTLIRAPFSGIVVSKNAQPGEMISPISAGGGFTRTGICTIVDMDSLEIEIDVNESYINRVQPGQAVEATLDAYPDWKIPAKVKAIIPTADRQKATVKVRVTFDKLDQRILPEMGVKVAFQGGGSGGSRAGTQSKAVLIPKSALRDDQGRDIVFLVNQGRAERRAVKVGNTDGEQAMIEAGLNPGDQVITAPPATLKDGEEVRVKRL